MHYEILYALKYSGEFGEDKLKEVVKILEDYQFTEFSLEGMVALKAVEIVMRKGLTLYDASYVALAYELNAILYTADERLIGKVGDPDRIGHVRYFQVLS